MLALRGVYTFDFPSCCSLVSQLAELLFAVVGPINGNSLCPLYIIYMLFSASAFPLTWLLWVLLRGCVVRVWLFCRICCFTCVLGVCSTCDCFVGLCGCIRSLPSVLVCVAVCWCFYFCFAVSRVLNLSPLPATSCRRLPNYLSIYVRFCTTHGVLSRGQRCTMYSLLPFSV